MVDVTTYNQPARFRFPDRKDTIVETFQSGHSWTLSGTSGTTFAADTSDYAFGSQSQKLITGGAGASHEVRSPVLSAIDLSAQQLVIAIKIDSFTHYSDLQLRVSSNGFSDYAYCKPLYTTAGQRWAEEGKWQLWTVGRGEVVSGFTWGNTQWNYVGAKANVNWSAITGIRFKVVDDAAGAITVRFNKVGYFPQPAKSVLSIVFDDTRDTHWTEARAYMDKNGLVGTSAVIASEIANGGYLTLAQLKAMNDVNGWSMIAHAYDNTGGTQAHSLGYDALSLADGEGDILALKAYMNEWGLDSPDVLALPHGSWSIAATNTDVLGMVAKHFAAARTTHPNTFETYPPADPYRLRSYSVQDTDTSTQWLNALDQIIAGKQWGMMQFHNIVASPSVSSEVTITNFRAFIDGVVTRVNNGSLICRTIPHVLQYGMV